MVGVGPHPEPWPTGPQWDPELLAEGDRRNVADRFRYLTVAAITEQLDAERSALHVAIENWQHDLNIGSIVRSANAFNVAGVHIIGRKDWNRRGAMVTDRYLHVQHHPDVDAFATWAADAGLPILGIDNIEGCRPIESAQLPRDCVMLFGQEGPGLSEAAVAACREVLGITQYGSTRSINASAAGAVAMFAWALQHRSAPTPATR
ncbi:MAG: RNA methyltransferase [Actinobacteria bacterium]|nr:RNA methyltransferase [Actinomycetota bacterium]MCB9411877.1 RNA methyltransferase [Actinomycetota bacterium]